MSVHVDASFPGYYPSVSMDELVAMLKNLDRKDVRELHLRVGSRPALLLIDGQVKAVSGLSLDFKGMLKLVKGTPVGKLVPDATSEGSTDRVVINDQDYAVTVYKRGVDLQIRIRPVAGVTRPLFQARRRLQLNAADGEPKDASLSPPLPSAPSAASAKLITTEVSGDDALARVFGRSLTPETLKAAELPPSPKLPFERPAATSPTKSEKRTAAYPTATKVSDYASAPTTSRHSQKTRPRVAAAELSVAPPPPIRAQPFREPEARRTGTTEPYYRLVGVIEHARTIGSTSVLLRAGVPVKFLGPGGLESSGPPLADGAVAQMVGHLMTTSHEEVLASRGFVCFTLTLRESGTVRVHVSITSQGLQASVRLVAAEPNDTGSLGIPKVLSDQLSSSGLVIVSAPRGHGKTTTLAALVRLLSGRRSAHTLMLSDHVEIPVDHHRALVTQRAFGGEHPSCAERIREGRTLDVDAVVVDELHGGDAVLAALHASASGHLVVAAMPSLNAATTLDRLLDQIPERKRTAARGLLADHLLMVTGQRLLRRANGKGHVAAWEWFCINPELRKAMHESDNMSLTGILAQTDDAEVGWLKDNVAALVSANHVEPAEANLLVTWDLSSRRTAASADGLVHRMGGIFRRKSASPKST